MGAARPMEGFKVLASGRAGVVGSPAMGLKLRILMVLACLLGLVVGWYGSSSIAGPAIRFHLVFLRATAAALGGTSAGLAFMLWHAKDKRLRAMLALAVGIGGIVGIGFWMAAWPDP